MLLAGDIGATKTLVGLFAPADPRPRLIDMRSFTTLAHPNLESILRLFLSAHPARTAVTAATFGVAGPIVNQVAKLTNVPWSVDAEAVRDLFDFPLVTLLNDLQSMAHSVPVLEADELEVLQDGDPVTTGNAALIAAGTGLGEALLHRVGGRLIPSPTEAGHTDFAPRTQREIGLLQDLIERYGRGEYEAVISGPGLLNVHRYLHMGASCPVPGLTGDPSGDPAVITNAALDGSCPRCVAALDLFVSVYGAEAGNLALRSVATAGVFVGGGIAPKILPAMRSGLFMESFRDKGPMTEVLSRIPVAVVLNERAGLLGAAVHAQASAGLP